MQKERERPEAIVDFETRPVGSPIGKFRRSKPFIHHSIASGHPVYAAFGNTLLPLRRDSQSSSAITLQGFILTTLCRVKVSMRTYSSWKSLEAPHEYRLLEALTAQQLPFGARMSATQLREMHSRAESWSPNFEDMYNSKISRLSV